MLEDRVVPYTTTGNAWPNPQVITISFVPDGTIVGSNGNGYIYSNLFQTFNAKFGSASVWENQILKAAQVWAQQTNINFAVVPDNGTPIGQGAYQQGDPNMGDIRISGYNFGTGTLASADLPPPGNNYSIAGDVQFNTGQSFNIGSTYDLFTVAAHEMGHALGLGESCNSLAVMYGVYQSARSGLNSDDISGIRAVYSGGNPRSPDTYYGGSTPNNSFASAANITSLIEPSTLTVVVNNLNISSTSVTEYYTFTAPVGSAGSMTVSVQSTGLSLLDPKLTIYAADQTTVLGTATGSGEQGNTLTVTVNGISPGQQFYVKVAGAVSTSFGTGAYALTLNLGTSGAPTVPLPSMQLLNGNPIQGSAGLPQQSGDDDDNGGPGQAGLQLPGANTQSQPHLPAAVAPQLSVTAALPGTGPQATQQAHPSAAVLPLVPVMVDATFSVPRTALRVQQPVLTPTPADIPAGVPALPAPGAGQAVLNGGGEALQSSSYMQPDQATAVPDRADPVENGTQSSPASPTTAPAAEARDAAFAEGTWMVGSIAGRVIPGPVAENAGGSLDSAGVAASIAALFSWGARPADREEQRRRPAA
jgi:hypothetical protein